MTEQLIIVGSGPAGYTAAIYAARAGLAPLVVAGAVSSGGSLMDTTEVENFPGFPAGVQGPELMEDLRRQAERFGARVLFDDAEELRLRGAEKVVRTAGGETHGAAAMILATGAAHRELGLARERALSGRGVSWCATCDGFFFTGRDVVVVGGGDSAMEEATFLTRFARSVTVVVRRGELRASRIMARRAADDPKISFLWHSEISDLLGDEQLESVMVRDIRDGAERTLAAAGLFVAIGHLPRSGLLHGQLDLDAEGYVRVSAPATRTSVPGVFACGDLVDRHYRQAVTAAGSGCAAAIDAERYLAAGAAVPGEAAGVEAYIRPVPSVQ
ncbi:thioredoxin-disulfide reductase [Leucobacter allii]|uniref:thioredoxin-disulfide reductase n=1 Tax=Leucobacter allii TaxID=2932247 RepID=UPI001FD06BAB|nr:thioredoxin-disulfide reductase [Leucobacter allii]UOR01794.1 thioredoxin-disulfide reductase [Leucobacter allii]